MHAVFANHSPRHQEKTSLLKICGLMQAQDVALCNELGVDFTGFIFVPASPRYIAPETVAAMPQGNAHRVGVFSGQPVAEVLDIMKIAKLAYAQLHGDEDEAFCHTIGSQRVIKVLWPQRFAIQDASLESASLLECLMQECERFAPVCSAFLLDAGCAGGGSGAFLPWQMLEKFTPPKPWFLAGGLGQDTLQEALCRCSPTGVDCNSALEVRPGVKDHAKIKACVAMLRNGNRTL